MTDHPENAGAPKIEITPEMLKAGERAFCAFDPRVENEATGAREVFLAMVRLSPQFASVLPLRRSACGHAPPTSRKRKRRRS